MKPCPLGRLRNSNCNAPNTSSTKASRLVSTCAYGTSKGNNITKIQIEPARLFCKAEPSARRTCTNFLDNRIYFRERRDFCGEASYSLTCRYVQIPIFPKPPNSHTGNMTKCNATNVADCGFHTGMAKPNQIFFNDLSQLMCVLK